MIEQKDSEILELAGFADRNRKAREVHSEPIFVQVNSKLAAYTIPGMRSEGTTYNVPTYSALKGAMDSIYKHVGMEAIPTAVYIHSPIKKTRILLRNIENIEGMRSRELSMSNKTNQSVLVNDTSSYYLKQYAALQFPGSVDNFGTKTPIHLLQQQEESEHSVSLREACDSDYDLDGAQFLFEGATYDSVTDLVKDNLCLDDEESIQKYNEHPRFDPFIPYDELVDKKNADREDIRDIRDSHRLDTMADYVDMYSTASGYDTADDITVLLPSSSYETVGMAFTHQALKQYEKSIDNHLFRKHRCYAACGEGYGREAGDYYPIMNFIRDAGEQLLIQDLENFDVKVMELASDDEVADFYCEHPHELFRAAYIKVSEKDTIGKCYSRLYVFCSGHEETFSDGSSFPVCDSHYVMAVKEGKGYKVPYPFDCNRFADELNKKSNEKERLTPAQRLFFWTEYKKPIE